MASALFSRILFSSRFLHSPRSLFQKPQLSSQIFHTRPFNSRAVEFSQYKLRTRLVYCVISSTNIEAKSYCTQAMSTNEPVVSVEWLHANLRQPDIKVLDASWYMPDELRNPIQEYQVAHIPGALFFDVDGIADRTTN